MAFQPRLDYILKFLGLIAPVLISSFLVLLSFYQANLKGLIYLAGLGINIVLTQAIKKQSQPRDNDPYRSSVCNLFDDSMQQTGLRTMPDLHASMLGFSLAYTLLPIFQQPSIIKRYWIFIIVMLVALIGSAYVKVALGCSLVKDIISGWIFGILIGGTFFIMVMSAPKGWQQVYFNGTSEKKNCSLNAAKFICSKRGDAGVCNKDRERECDNNDDCSGDDVCLN